LPNAKESNNNMKIKPEGIYYQKFGFVWKRIV